MSGKKPHHDPHYARGNQRYEGMLKELGKDECGLCTLRVHPKPVLQRAGVGTKYEWYITERYEVPEGVQAYLLIAPARHVTTHTALTRADKRAVQELERWAKKEFKLKGYGLVIRTGDTKLTGATGRHLHYHLIMPEIDPGTGRAKPYYFPIG